MYCIGLKMYSDATWAKLYLSCSIARAEFPACALGSPGECAAVAGLEELGRGASGPALACA